MDGEHPIIGRVPYPFWHPDAKALYRELVKAIPSIGYIQIIYKQSVENPDALPEPLAAGRAWELVLEGAAAAQRLRDLFKTLRDRPEAKTLEPFIKAVEEATFVPQPEPAPPSPPPAPPSERDWRLRLQLIVFLLTIVSPFLIPPPVGAAQFADSITWTRATAFVFSLLAGVVLGAAQIWRQSRYAYIWIGTTLAGVLLSVTLTRSYSEKAADWTCRYTETVRRVVGDTFTDRGREYVTANPDKTCDRLVFEFQDVELVWTRESIDRRRRILARVYCGVPAALGATVICLIQAMALAQAKRRETPRVTVA